MVYAKTNNINLSNVTQRSDYVVRLVRAVPSICSDLTSDAEKPLFWCPLGHANTARSGGHVREGFLDSWRSAAPFCMSTDGPSSCQWCTRSARSGRTARGRCGARTRRARASQRTPSCTAGLAEGAAAALPRRAWGKGYLDDQDLNQQTGFVETRARARRMS